MPILAIKLSRFGEVSEYFSLSLLFMLMTIEASKFRQEISLSFCSLLNTNQFHQNPPTSFHNPPKPRLSFFRKDLLLIMQLYQSNNLISFIFCIFV